VGGANCPALRARQAAQPPLFSLYELNAAIRETVADLNAKIMRKLGVSRDELFAEIDRPGLKALPAAPYQFSEWKKCRARLPR
jgi:hypothetical protein